MAGSGRVMFEEGVGKKRRGELVGVCEGQFKEGVLK
jgi:hypothetical protein